MRLTRILATGSILVAIGSACFGQGSAQAQVLTRFAPTQLTNADPASLVAGPDGNMWFVSGLGSVGNITPNGQVTLFSSGITSGANPAAIVSAQDGNLYFGEPGIAALGRITPAGVVAEFSVGAEIRNMIAAPDGSLWFSDDASTVGRFQLDGTLTLFEIQNPPDPGLGVLTIGPDGNIWIAANNFNALAKASTSGAVLSVIGLPPGATVSGITNGPDGAVWFTEGANAVIGRVTPDGSLSQFPAGIGAGRLGQIVLGPDGNLWFGETSTTRIDRITPQGVVTPFLDHNPQEFSPATVAASSVAGIAPGPRGTGTIWFGGQNNITRLSLPGPTPLAAAVLPGGRSVAVSAPATVFATMLNAGPSALTNCHVALPATAPAGLQLTYQTTNPATNALIGQPNQPVTIPPDDGFQTFLLAFQSSDGFEQLLMPLDFACDQAGATVLPGIDTVNLLAIPRAATTLPDFIAVSASPTPGILHVPVNGSAAFAVSIKNVGGQEFGFNFADITLNTGIAVLPITATICQTDPTTAACMQPAAATASIPTTAGASATYSVFISATGPVPLSPGLNRIFVDIDYFDGVGSSHSFTSLALEAP